MTSRCLSAAQILDELEKPLEFDGDISEIEGVSSDEDYNEDIVLEPEVESDGDSSDIASNNITEKCGRQKSRSAPPWRHTDTFEPLPPAPAFEETVWQGKECDTKEYFLKYIPYEVFQVLSSCSNQSSVARTGKSLNTTPQEIMTFFGISMKMSYLGYPRVNMYWAMGTRVTEIAEKMSRTRFFSIRSALKLVIDSDVASDVRSKDKYWKIRPLLKTVRAGCLLNPRTQKVSIDEQIIPFWGKTTMRQYIRGKPNPCGLKNFVCTSPDGLPLDFFMYEGKGDTILEGYDYLNIGGKVVMRLATTLPAGCTIYMDRYFTSVELLDCLHSDRGCQGTGTIQSCRVPSESHLQSDGDMKKAGRGTVDQSVRGDGQVAIIKWYDNKAVIIASSVEGKLPLGQCRRWSKQDREYVNVSRPLAVEKYNENMGGVDKLDRVIAEYRQSARTRKWTVRMILHLFDFACAASWIEYRRDCIALKTRRKNMKDYLKFKIEISEWLLHSGNDPFDMNNEYVEEDEEADTVSTALKRKSVTSAIPSEAKWKSSAIHMPEVADDEKTHRCRRPGCKNVRARVFCTECKIHLCLVKGRNCFQDFHMH